MLTAVIVLFCDTSVLSDGLWVNNVIELLEITEEGIPFGSSILLLSIFLQIPKMCCGWTKLFPVIDPFAFVPNNRQSSWRRI